MWMKHPELSDSPPVEVSEDSFGAWEKVGWKSVEDPSEQGEPAPRTKKTDPPPAPSGNDKE